MRLFNRGLGTGSNAAYIERVDRIGKRDITMLGNDAEASTQEMAINIEFGAFDNERTVLPMTMFDNKVDRKSLVSYPHLRRRPPSSYNITVAKQS